MRRPRGALALVAALSFASGAWLLRRDPAAGGSVWREARLFEDVVHAISTHHIDSLGEGRLYRDAARSLVASLGDPYAELLMGESYLRYQRQMSGTELEGTRAGQPGSPRGAAGTAGGALVHVPAAAPGMLLRDRVGYVALRAMSEDAAEELHAAIEQLAGRGMTALVLDLRHNPGGLISEGVSVANLFLRPGDTIATSHGRTPAHSKVYVAQGPGRWGKLPLAVLVDRGTASSAELVAGALQDHDRAVVVGTPTYGKGVLQTTYPLGENVALKLTTARWYTPSGRSVQRPVPDSAGASRAASRPGPAEPAGRPRAYRTRSGRALSAAGGVVPDLVVRAPRAQGERALLAALGPDVELFRAAVTAHVADLRARGFGGDDPFHAGPATREELLLRLRADGVAVPAETFAAAADYVDDQVALELARQLGGDSAEEERRALTDRQLQAAVRVLRRARTAAQAVAIAEAERSRAADQRRAP